MRNRAFRLVVVLFVIISAVSQLSRGVLAEDEPQSKKDSVPTISADGTIILPSIRVPLSEHLSRQAAEAVAEYFNVLNRSAREGIDYNDAKYVSDFFARGPVLAARLYPTKMTEAEIAGVRIRTYLPRDGRVDDERRILINLHGGGFRTGWPDIADEESVPIASKGHFKVISVDYRETPNHFPAASEDVAAVYRELLKTHHAEQIGIYGCSAGGFLVAESLAWFQEHGLPRPGAAGIFCSSAEGYSGGDADYLSGPLIGMAAEDPTKWGASRGVDGAPYFQGADFNSPLVSPIVSDRTLSQFPPTLIITATRAGDMSAAVFTHSKLVSLGVDAELHVWEGLPHGFYAFLPDLPESRQAVDVIVNFFHKHLDENRK